MEHHDDFNRSTKKGSPRPGPLPVTSLYVDDPSEEKIEGTQLNCPDKIIKRSIFKPAVGYAPTAHEIPAGILRLAWDNPVGHGLIEHLILGDLSSRYTLPRFLGSWIKSWLYYRTLAVRFHSLQLLHNEIVRLTPPHSRLYFSSPKSTTFLSETMIFSSWTIAT